MKKLLLIILCLFIQTSLKTFGAEYHQAYNLNGEKVFEYSEGNIIYYSPEATIIKDKQGYFLRLKNGKRSKHYNFLAKTPYGPYFIVGNDLYDNINPNILDSKGKIIITSDNNYNWDFIYLDNGDIIVYDEKDKNSYKIDKTGKKTKITEEEFDKYYEYSEKRKADFKNYSVTRNELCGIELAGQVIIPDKYEDIKTSSKYFTFKHNSLWGVSDYSGNIILKPTFKNKIKVIGDYILLTEDEDF